MLSFVMNFHSASQGMISNTDENNYMRESESIIHCHISKYCLRITIAIMIIYICILHKSSVLFV